MSIASWLVALFALGLGLAGGYVLARRRRLANGPTPVPYDTDDTETRPTLVPVRHPRESGRNLAKLQPDAER